MVSLTCTALLDIQKMAFEKERRELLEAAEFEGRVAKRLATERGWWTPCIETHKCEETAQFPSKFGIENWGKCDWCKLKWTRLMVEEEMDGTDGSRT